MMLIKNASAYIDGRIQSGTDILIEKKRIAKIGKDISANSAEIVEAEGKFVFPGFIDPVTKVGTFQKGNRGSTESDELTSHITPEMHSQYAIDYTRVNEQAFYKCGITSVGVTCGDMNVISGQMTAIKTYSDCHAELIISDRVGLSGSVTDFVLRAHSHKGLLTDKEAVFSQLESALKDLFGKGKAAEEHTRLFISVETAEEIQRVLHITENFPVDLVLVGAYQAHLCSDAIRKAGASLIIGDQMYMAYNVYRADCKEICELGACGTALTTIASMPRGASVLLWNIIHTVSSGVAWEKVADMVTIEPAKLLGIDERVGSLTTGKDADLVIWSGNPFLCCDARVEATLIEAKMAYTSEDFCREMGRAPMLPKA